MNLVLLGAPGSGKGTQAERLVVAKGLRHVATGDLVRAEVARDSEMGKRIGDYMRRGDLVPDELILEMLRGALQQPPGMGAGVVFDGYPRTRSQAEGLDGLLSGLGTGIDCVLLLEVPEELLVSRLSSRWACPKCGTLYNTETAPPRSTGVCDRCATALVQRADDTADTAQHRIRVMSPSADLLDHYSSRGLLRRVDGSGEVDEVTHQLEEALAEAA